MEILGWVAFGQIEFVEALDGEYEETAGNDPEKMLSALKGFSNVARQNAGSS